MSIAAIGFSREMINVIEYVFVLCRKVLIQPDHLPIDILPARDCTARYSRDQESEKREIEEALRTTGGRKEEASLLLGISRVTLWKSSKKYRSGMQG